MAGCANLQGNYKLRRSHFCSIRLQPLFLIDVELDVVCLNPFRHCSVAKSYKLHTCFFLMIPQYMYDEIFNWMKLEQPASFVDET